MPAELYLDCPTCARPRPVEQPPCAEDHGPDCPERLCADCGTALLVGPAPTADRESHTHLGIGRRAA